MLLYHHGRLDTIGQRASGREGQRQGNMGFGGLITQSGTTYTEAYFAGKRNSDLVIQLIV